MNPESITVTMHGSSLNYYDVSLIKSGDVLSIHCSCSAFDFSTLCKHRLALLSGDTSRLVKPNEEPNKTNWNKIQAALFGSKLSVAYAEFKTHLASLEEEKNIVQTKLKTLKKQFSRSIITGI